MDITDEKITVEPDIEDLWNDIQRSTHVKKKLTLTYQLANKLKHSDDGPGKFIILCKQFNSTYNNNKDSICFLQIAYRFLTFSRKKLLQDTMNWQVVARAILTAFKLIGDKELIYDGSSKRDKLLVLTLQEIPQNILKEIFEKTKDSQDFMLIARFFSHTPELLKKMSPFVLNRLNEEFLIDKSLREIRLTPYLNEIITIDTLKSELFPNAIKLIKRSESNIDTLNALLEGLTLDISDIAPTLLFENLKELFSFNGVYAKKFLETIKLIAARCAKQDARQYILQKLLPMVLTESSEPAKAYLLHAALDVIELLDEQERSKGFASWSDKMSKTVPYLASEEHLERLLESLSRATTFKSQPITIADDNWTIYKKILNSPSPNKYVFSIVCKMLEIFLLAAADGPNALRPLETIFEPVYTTYIQICFKNPAKIISSFPFLLNVLHVASRLAYEKKSEKICNSLPNDITVILDQGIYINQFKFFQKASAYEILQLFEIIVYNFSAFCQQDEKLEERMSVLESTLFEIVNNKTIRIVQVVQGLKRIEKKHEFATLLLNGVIAKFLLQPEVHLIYRIFSIFKLVIPWLDLENITPQALVSFMIAITHPVFNLERWCFYKFSKNKEFKQRAVAAIEKHYDYIKDTLLLKEGMFSQDRRLLNTFKGVFSLLLKIYKPQIPERLKFLLKKENYFDNAELKRFEEEVKDNWSDFFLSIQARKELWIHLGFHEPPKEIKESKAPKDGKAKFDTPQKRLKASKKPSKEDFDEEIEPKYFVDNEVKMRRLALLQEKMLSYLSVVCDALKTVIQQADPQFIIEFFDNIFEDFIPLFSITAIRGQIQDVLFHLFVSAPYRAIKRRASVLCAVYYSKITSKEEIFYEGLSNKLPDVLKLLSTLDFKAVNQVWSKIIYDSCQHLLVGVKGINLKERTTALSIIIQIGQNAKAERFTTEILNMIIEHLDKLSSFEDTKSFFIFLLEKAKEESFDELFARILEYNQAACKLTLESLLSIEKPDLISSFDRYIKLLSLKYDETREIKELAAQILENFKMNLSVSDVESFDFLEYVKNHKRKRIDNLSHSAPELFEKIPNCSKIVVTRMINTGVKLIKVGKQVDDETLAFLPHFLKDNIQFVDDESLTEAFKAFVEYYCTEARPKLTDTTVEVAMELINIVGPKKGDLLLSVLEKYLDKKFSSQINATAITFMGQASPFLSDTSKVPSICNKILNIANSSSVQLQKSLAKCLPNLINFFENPIKIAEDLLASLKTEEKLDNMRGSAYLLAGFVKGFGMKYLEKMKIMDFLMQDLDVKKESKSRKLSVLVLIETLAENLQKIIAPYLVHILNVLMKFFGSQDEDIRSQSLRCSKVLMSTLSTYGVKQILPLLLQGVDDKSWRTKVASISILGNMTFCAPKQLSSCLPQIVPKLAGAISDANIQVKDSANYALKEIGSTIKSPEISSILDILIKALSDPYEQNKNGLEALLKLEFTHYIDAPSLSLIIPIIDYGLRNRDLAIKKKSSQLVENISDLVKDPDDIIPYLDILLASLQSSLSQISEISSKAYASLARKLGIQKSSKVVLSLRNILEDKEATPAERTGAAQAISEVTYALGYQYFKEVLPNFLLFTRNENSYIRESYTRIFVYLPNIMENQFQPYIADLLDSIMDSLAEENENLRHLAFSVVKNLIQIFGAKDIQTLLEPVEEGLFHENPNKRVSSIYLIDEMLKVLKESVHIGNMSEEEFNVILKRILCSLHILKSDPFSKADAAKLWKELVVKQKQTIKKILRPLLEKIINLLTNCYHFLDTIKLYLEEFSKQYGGCVLEGIIVFLPELKEKYWTTDKRKFNNLFLALNKIISPESNFYINHKKEPLLKFVREFLITSEDVLRHYSCQFLNTLILKCPPHSKVLETTMTEFFDEFEQVKEDSEDYSKYLKFFNEMIPPNLGAYSKYFESMLFSEPLRQYKLDIILGNVETIGPKLYQSTKKDKRLVFLFEQFFDEECNPAIKSTIIYCINQLSVNLTQDRVSYFLQNCYDLIESSNYEWKREKVYFGLQALRFYFRHTYQPFNEHIPLLLTGTSAYFQSEDKKVLSFLNEIHQAALGFLEESACFVALKSFVKRVRFCLLQTQNKQQELYIRAFSIENGIEPFLHIMTTSLAVGSTDDCKFALVAYEYVTKYTKSEFLQPFVTRLVGPLIRAAAFRSELDIRTKVLQRISAFEELGHSIKEFLPQLQAMALRAILDYQDQKDYLKAIAKVFECIARGSSQKEHIYKMLYAKYAKEENQSFKYAYLNSLKHVVKVSSKDLPLTFVASFTQDLLKITDAHWQDKRIGYVSKIISFLIAVAEPKEQKGVLDLIMTSLEKDTTSKNVLKFSHLLKILKVVSFDFLKENYKTEAIQGIIKSFLKHTQHHETIAWIVADLTKLAKIDQDRKDLVKGAIGADLKAILSSHLDNEKVAKGLQALQVALT